MQFIVIDKIYVEITNARDNRFNVYFHLVVNGYNVGILRELSCLTLFFGLKNLFRRREAMIEKIVPSVS